MDDQGSPNKRRKLEIESTGERRHGDTRTTSTPVTQRKAASLSREISPPSTKRKRRTLPWQTTARSASSAAPHTGHVTASLPTIIPSPIQLTHIQDLSPAENVDAVKLGDILGDPLIKECWNFNYLFDLDFVMNAFDPDVRPLVKVMIVHGSWKRDDPRRIRMEQTSQHYPNVSLISAYMPEPFGTHHTKMLILFRHDDTAQVIIHTANMISRDWGNMTQAMWRSPALPLISGPAINAADEGPKFEIKLATPPPSSSTSMSTASNIPNEHPIGTGQRFKSDLLRYIHSYGNRLTALSTELEKYDFRDVRAALISSTPSRQRVSAGKSTRETAFGYLGLRQILSQVPISAGVVGESGGKKIAKEKEDERPNIVIQISSIATLGQTPEWLRNFQEILSQSRSRSSPSSSSSSTSPKFMKATAMFTMTTKKKKPKFNIIFPTPQEIRTSLDGYDSGDSIHTKLQSAAQQKQLSYLHPLLCHWTHHDSSAPAPASPSPNQQTPHKHQHQHRHALRNRAAPHIKTYIRFSSSSSSSAQSPPRIDWAMLTSANLSQQAWGTLENKDGVVRVASYEIGVVVWPELYKSGDEEEIIMVPAFGKDGPEQEDVRRVGGEIGDRDRDGGEGDGDGDGVGEGKKLKIVGFRMPYDLPLVPYAEDEMPWCATMEYDEPDWKGEVWEGY